MGQATDDYILVMFCITIWIQDFFEGFLPRVHHGADTDVMRGCTGFYAYVAPLGCGASAVSPTPELLGGGLHSPSAFLVSL